MSRLEARFLEKLGDSWEEATPGFCVQAYSRGKKIVDIEVGETYPMYDLASLTKIVFTTSAFMFLHDEKSFRLNDPISRWVPWFPEKRRLTLKHPLSHSVGLTWWHPFYKSLVKKTDQNSTPEEAWSVFQGLLRNKILADFRKPSRVTGEAEGVKSVYSDLDFFMLGLALEAISGQTLYENWQGVRERLGLENTDFHRANKPRGGKRKFAPTETDEWRGTTLQGEVHDENTWALKGVAPHAGLFGPIGDLSRFGLLLRASMRGKRSAGFASPEAVRLFTRRSIPKARGDWALGFMMPTKGSASCGSLFSPQSVGHTGFTGTSLWYDPRKDLLVTILSNRVHPTRNNKRFVGLRPQIHTWIAEEL
jgi:serine-type D-Ala-D-Ala carboxypeptidase